MMSDNADTLPSSLIDETISVEFKTEPMYEKAPDCPVAFTWRGKTYRITRVLSECQDFRRRGKYAKNMTPAHLSAAQRMGSWGVERYNFCVEVESGQIFEIYYDRSPDNAEKRKGNWILKGERIAKNK